jgi:hypothetical protein
MYKYNSKSYILRNYARNRSLPQRNIITIPIVITIQYTYSKIF